MIPLYPYDPALFDKDYYGGGARGGFVKYEYDDPDQQEQLKYKWDACHWSGDFESILFVGSAMGFEVKYFKDKGKIVGGVDVSEYAIKHALPGTARHMMLYDGRNLDFRENGSDIVAAFDVLTLIPDEMMRQLGKEIVRVAYKKIVMRSIVKNWRNAKEKWDGNDGVSFTYKPFDYWDWLFSESGKFRFEECKMWRQYEGVFVWVRA